MCHIRDTIEGKEGEHLELDYTEIGKRIAKRRKELGLRQAQLSEMVDISDPYLSNIERAVSIPSTEVIMRLAIALDTTPDEFLVGTSQRSEAWKDVASLLRPMSPRELEMARGLLTWLKEQNIKE